MTLIKRSSKGSALSYDEMDGNFEYLRSQVRCKIIETLVMEIAKVKLLLWSLVHTHYKMLLFCNNGTNSWTPVTGSTINYTFPCRNNKGNI